MYYPKKIPAPFGNCPQKTESISIPIEAAEKITSPHVPQKNDFSPLAFMFLIGSILKKGDE